MIFGFNQKWISKKVGSFFSCRPFFTPAQTANSFDVLIAGKMADPSPVVRFPNA